MRERRLMVSNFIHKIKIKEWNTLKLYLVKELEKYNLYMRQWLNR